MIDIQDIAVHVPLAVTLTLITGALARAVLPDPWPRRLGTLAASLLGTMTLWSYLAPINLGLAAALLLAGCAAALGAAVTAPRGLLLIETLALPIWLLGVVTVGAWF